METQTTETVAFEQRVDRLAKHLLRAGKGHKAAILFAVYISEITRAAAEVLLETQLQEAGETIGRVRVQSEGETVDLPSCLRNHPQNGQAIFFIYDVARGGNATQQYLNYRREFLVEDQQRLLFWLHENEIGQLARNAPDFWAFRGRTLEFLERFSPQSRAGLVDHLAYHNWSGDGSQKKSELEIGIHFREQLLNELPEESAFSRNRAELLYTLASLYQMRGNSEKALMLINEAEENADPSDKKQLSRIYSGRGNIYRSLNKFEESINDVTEAIRLNPQYAHAYNNRGNTYRDQGRLDKALADYETAIQLNPTDSFPYFNSAVLQMALDRPEEALEYLAQGLRIDPDERKHVAEHSTFAPLWDDPRFRALVEPNEEDEEA